jgi:magnesium transporter
VEALEQTNESVIYHKQGHVLSVLTVIATIVLPLTLIASIFGMNVGVPGEGSTAAFWVLVGGMLALGIGMFGYFRWKRWL